MTETIQEYFDEFDGMIFAQKDGPNTVPEPIPCATIDGVDQPQGDIVRRFCRTNDGGIKTANTSQGTPSSATFDVTMWKAKRRDVFQRAMERRCMIPIYVAHGLCTGRQDNILSWDEYEIYQDPYVTSKGKSNLARGQREEGDNAEMVGLTYSMSAEPTVHELYKLVTTTTVAYRATYTEDEPLYDITTCTVPRCPLAGCGAPQEPCDEIHIIADSAAGTFKAVGYESTDNAGSFAAWTGVFATVPFAATTGMASVVCFMMDDTTERILVAPHAAGAANLQVAYSDDGGATWTLATVAVTNTDYAVHSGALFALDYRHIWLCTFEADVYFSSDGGVTWTDQVAPAPAANERLYYIHFIDEYFGWAVGGYPATPTCHLIQTTDGGEHWNMAAAEPSGTAENATCVAVLDAQNVWIGRGDGWLYYTQNWGTTWTRRVLPSALSTTSGLADIQFVDHYVGALCGYDDGVTGYGVPTVMRTIDGGFTWEEYNLDTLEFTVAVEHMGVNALLICGVNEIHSVTEALADDWSRVWTLKPAGWT